MTDNHLHIVSFTIPYPANYGGVIDVFHKLTALHTAGLKIHLHCFRYDREPAPLLESYCESVHYYERNKRFSDQISHLPFIIKSRDSRELLENLLKDDYPILFEGIHSCFHLTNPSLRNRMLIYRESNIEHHYYYHLCKAERNGFRKAFFLLESLKLKLFQKKLKRADLMMVVSEEDRKYLSGIFPDKKIHFIPSFHGNSKVDVKTGRGDFVLYHGNLSVAENIRAAEFLITNVFNGIEIPLVIAGLNPPDYLVRLAENQKMRLYSNPSDEQLHQLIREAQVHLLVTFQATGLKLKLLNTLFRGRHVLVNPAMLKGTGLDDLCHCAEGSEKLRNKLVELFDMDFDEGMLRKRQTILESRFSDAQNALVIKKLIFGSAES
jgi:hypothetical protein